jgi:spermidine synthase
LIGYLSGVLSPKAPQSALVIGFGSGVSVTALASFSSLKRLECVEIEPAVIAAAPLFTRVNQMVLEDPRVRVTIDDARHYLRASRTRYDVIVSEPSNPWLAGVANLYTQEAFAAAKARLSLDGVFCQWFHSYSMSAADFALIVKTFQSVFPNAQLFTTGDKDFFLIGTAGDWTIPFPQIQTAFQSNPAMVDDLRRLGLGHPVTLLATTFLLDSAELAELARAAPVHRDNRPTLEFSAPKALQFSQDREILDLLLAKKTKSFPPNVTHFNPTPREWVDLNNMVGEAFMRAQKLGLADSYFSKAMELNRNVARTHINKGRVFNALDQHLQAELAFRQALELEPRSALGWFHLGMLYVSQAMSDKGLAMIEKGLALSPGDPMGSLQASQLYIAKGDAASARKILNAALARPRISDNARASLQQLRDSLDQAAQ